MKVSELIQHLQEFMDDYGDFTVIKSRDDEGNGFSQINHVNPQLVETAEVGSWSIESIYEIGDEPGDEIPENVTEVVCLW